MNDTGRSKKAAWTAVFDIRNLAGILQQRPSSTEFVTFWHGPLDPITFTCLASFPHHGAALTVYTYDTSIRVPEGVKVRDARRIVADESLIERYLVHGSASFSKFSNYFRYRLLQKTGACWVDGDILCLRRPDFTQSPLVFGYQFRNDGPWALNGAVLKLPRNHPMLADLAERAAAAVDIDTRWGVIGPMLVSEMAAKHDVMHHARPHTEFYPVAFRKFFRVLLPGYRQGLDAATRNSTFLHLWNEFYRKCGYDKTIAPPVGSFLHQQFVRLGTLGQFQGTYRREEMLELLGDFIND
jgi:hypothetical protein